MVTLHFGIRTASYTNSTLCPTHSADEAPLGTLNMASWHTQLSTMFVGAGTSCYHACSVAGCPASSSSSTQPCHVRSPTRAAAPAPPAAARSCAGGSSRRRRAGTPPGARSTLSRTHLRPRTRLLCITCTWLASASAFGKKPLKRRKEHGDALKHATCGKIGAGSSAMRASLYQAPQPQADSSTLHVLRNKLAS